MSLHHISLDLETRTGRRRHILKISPIYGEACLLPPPGCIGVRQDIIILLFGLCASKSILLCARERYLTFRIRRTARTLLHPPSDQWRTGHQGDRCRQTWMVTVFTSLNFIYYQIYGLNFQVYKPANKASKPQQVHKSQTRKAPNKKFLTN